MRKLGGAALFEFGQGGGGAGDKFFQHRCKVKIRLGLQCCEAVFRLCRDIAPQLFYQGFGIAELPHELSGGQLGLLPLE